jgi:hypothetical protein
MRGGGPALMRPQATASRNSLWLMSGMSFMLEKMWYTSFLSILRSLGKAAELGRAAPHAAILRTCRSLPRRGTVV